MTHEMRKPLRQRADYTHKFNATAGRHGWLRLTPAHSKKMTEKIIGQYGTDLHVFDPFCGTGTTALSAVQRGHRTAAADINPFLVWLARAKTASYPAATVAQAAEAGRAALDLADRKAVPPAPAPPIHKVERWWSEPALQFLCLLKQAIAEVARSSGPAADLLNISFCRTLIGLSNAAFNHQSMSFRSDTQLALGAGLNAADIFRNDLAFVLEGAKRSLRGKASIALGDARNLPGYIKAKFDIVVTSPPYANRMSYIRELRPYMYWLGYLLRGRDAAELDWTAIGGTWGAATSRLKEWSASGDHWLPDEVPPMLEKIAHSGNANGALLSNYVAKYCEDMSAHFACLPPLLNPGARIHYLVGNSTFYGVLVPTERLYAGMMRRYGFTDINVQPIRKRNSKKELIEFDVSATWPG